MRTHSSPSINQIMSRKTSAFILYKLKMKACMHQKVRGTVLKWKDPAAEPLRRVLEGASNACTAGSSATPRHPKTQLDSSSKHWAEGFRSFAPVATLPDITKRLCEPIHVADEGQWDIGLSFRNQPHVATPTDHLRRLGLRRSCAATSRRTRG